MLLWIMRTGVFLPAGQKSGARPAGVVVWGGGCVLCSVFFSLRVFFCVWLVLAAAVAGAKDATKSADLWSLRPLIRPQVPRGICSSTNPIDAFIGETRSEEHTSELQ